MMKAIPTRTRSICARAAAAAALLAVALSGTACKHSRAHRTGAGTSAAAPAPANGGGGAGAASTAALLGVLATYDQIRVNLANDDAAGVPALAAELAAKAGKAAAAAAPGARAALARVAAAATKLASTPSDHLAPLRLGFGEVSRPVVALVAATPALSRGLHIFRCDKVKRGYAEWVQTSTRIEDPYTGTNMQSCGTEVGPGGGRLPPAGGGAGRSRPAAPAR